MIKINKIPFLKSNEYHFLSESCGNHMTQMFSIIVFLCSVELLICYFINLRLLLLFIYTIFYDDNKSQKLLIEARWSLTKKRLSSIETTKGYGLS
jgi:uncharacterized membrane protein